MRALVVGAALSLLAGGCITTASEGAAMRADIDQLKSEMAEMDKREDDRRADVDKKLAAVSERIGELETTLSNIRQAEADAGVQMEKVIAELQRLRGDVEEARFQLGETKKTVEDILERPPVSVAAAEGASTAGAENDLVAGAPAPADKKALYELDKKLFDEKKYDDSIKAFGLYVTRFADDTELIDNAWFWKGESHYAKASSLADKKQQADEYRQAVLAYQKVLQLPRANKADGALYKIGLSFEALGFAEEATVFYEELLAKHPKSSLAGETKKRLSAVASKSKKKKKR